MPKNFGQSIALCKILKKGCVTKMNEQEIFERITYAEQSIKSAHHRIDEISESGKSISEILVEMKYMRRDLNELLERVGYIEKKPAKRYDIILNAIITAVIAAAISFFIK